MAAWKLPLVVGAIAVPVALAFYFGGPGVGVGVGALVALALVVVAARERPRGTIEPLSDSSGTRDLLVVLGDPLEDPEAIERLSDLIENGSSTPRVLMLAPAQIGFLDRWASDVEGARRDAQRRLVVSVAALAAAGITAEARVGDENIVQAVEDQLGTFPASEVILVSSDGNNAATEAAQELRGRLRVAFRQLFTGPAGR